MSTQDRITLAGFISLGALMIAMMALTVALFDWLRDDIARIEQNLRAEIAELQDGQDELREGQAEDRERAARIEGTVAGALGRPLPRTPPSTPHDGAGPANEARN